jgi:hypothetical protein
MLKTMKRIEKILEDKICRFTIVRDGAISRLEEIDGKIATLTKQSEEVRLQIKKIEESK